MEDGIPKAAWPHGFSHCRLCGNEGLHLPLYSVNEDQLPDQYDICGTDKRQTQCNGHLLSDVVTNPMSAANGGPIATNVPTLGAKTITYGYLLKPIRGIST